LIFDQLRPSFTIGKISASSLGPATTLEIAVKKNQGDGSFDFSGKI
jgi:hypothetical protein